MIRAVLFGVLVSAPAANAAEDDWISDFSNQVSACWSTGAMSDRAQSTTIVMAFDMRPDRRPDTGSMEMLSFDGGDAGHAAEVFRSARFAVIRCAGDGYALPADQYEFWHRIEMTIDPMQMEQG